MKVKSYVILATLLLALSACTTATPAPTPTLDHERVYVEQVAAILNDRYNAEKNMLVLVVDSDDRNADRDKTNTDLSIAFEKVRNFVRRVRALDPPTRMRDIHDALLSMARHDEAFVELGQVNLTERDMLSHVMRSGKIIDEIKLANASNERADSKLEALGYHVAVRKVTVRAPTQTPVPK